jgi:hypothetical protein
MSVDIPSVGDLVKVKPGILDPDGFLVSDGGRNERHLDHSIPRVLSIAGWQGKVTSVHPEEGENGATIIYIEWDSQTLQKIPKKLIKAWDKDNLSCTEMGLFPDDVDIIEKN